MQFNPTVIKLIDELTIQRDLGLFYLLGIYHNLDVDLFIPENVIKEMNLTKIVERDYEAKTIKWNIPLFLENGAGNFEWVADWIEPFGRLNPERKGSYRDAIPRMKDFFAKYPEFRKEDVYRARDLYLASITNPKFLMKSHKFIFDGSGVMKKSELLSWCEKAVSSNTDSSNQRGKVIS